MRGPTPAFAMMMIASAFSRDPDSGDPDLAWVRPPQGPSG